MKSFKHSVDNTVGTVLDWAEKKVSLHRNPWKKVPEAQLDLLILATLDRAHLCDANAHEGLQEKNTVSAGFWSEQAHECYTLNSELNRELNRRSGLV